MARYHLEVVPRVQERYVVQIHCELYVVPLLLAVSHPPHLSQLVLEKLLVQLFRDWVRGKEREIVCRTWNHMVASAVRVLLHVEDVVRVPPEKVLEEIRLQKAQPLLSSGPLVEAVR